MTKKNIYLIIGVAAVVFLLLIGVLFLYNRIPKVPASPSAKQPTNQGVDNSNSNKTVNKSVASSSSPAVGSVKSSNTPLDLAERLNDINQCFNGGYGQSYIDSCISLTAIKAGNKSECAKISNQAQSQYCTDMITYSATLVSGKISDCSGIVGDRLNSACVSNIVAKMPNLKNSDCGTLPTREQPPCFYYVSYFADSILLNNAKSSSDCQNISPGGVKTECLLKFQ